MSRNGIHSNASIVVRVVIGVVLIVVHVHSGRYVLAAIGALSILSALVSLLRRGRPTGRLEGDASRPGGS